MTGSGNSELGKLSIDADRYLKFLDGEDCSQSDAPRHETIEETRERILASNASKCSNESKSSFASEHEESLSESPISSRSSYPLVFLGIFIISLGFCCGLWFVRHLFISEARLVFSSGNGLIVNAEKSRAPAATLISRLSVLTTLMPWDSNAAGLKARAHVARGEFDLAMENVNRSLSYDPTNIDALFAKANVNHELKRSSSLEHITALTSIIKLKPDFVPAYRNRSNALERIGRTSEAIDDLSTALSLNPDVPEVLIERARLHASNGSRSSACTDYRKFVEIKESKLNDGLNSQWASYCR